MKINVLLILTFSLCFAMDAHAQVSGASAELKIDWRHQDAVLTLSTQQRTDGKNRLAQLSRQQEELRSEMPPRFLALIGSLRIDSNHTLNDFLFADTQLEIELLDWLRTVNPDLTRPSHSLDSIMAAWTIGLHDLIYPSIGPLMAPRSGYIQDRVAGLPFASDRPVSSVVIYAPDALPWHGMGEMKNLVPALFPELLDNRGLPFLPVTGLNTRASGPTVIYTSEKEYASLYDQAGLNPYVIRPLAVFGKNPVDVLLAKQDQEVLLTSTSAQESMRSGKLIMVISEDALLEIQGKL